MLDPTAGATSERRVKFDAILDAFLRDAHPFRRHMADVMKSFAPGLFAGGDDLDLPDDNLDMERWFRQPKSHERRIHGRSHAGVRIVQEGPTLAPTLDAHLAHPDPFTCAELIPYRHVPPPACQLDAIRQRKTMRKARSTQRRPLLLAQLEQRYLDTT